MVMMLALGAGIAFAAIVRCDDTSCNGTNKADRIFEQRGEKTDIINARGGADVVDAASFGSGENTSFDDSDRVLGGRNNDRIRVDDGDGLDSIDCGSGRRDIAVVDASESKDGAQNCEDVRMDLETTINFFTAAADEIISGSEPAK